LPGQALRGVAENQAEEEKTSLLFKDERIDSGFDRV